MLQRLDLDSLEDPRRAEAVDVLESGGLVVLPRLPFAVELGERGFLDPALLRPGVKNISLDPASGRVSGAQTTDPNPLAAMLERYAAFATQAVSAVAPAYAAHLQRRRTSFRPGPVDTRVLSPRKDDRRLHTDAFPANPVQGRRILRLFTNVDPDGRDRVWQAGTDGIEALAARFRPRFTEGGLAVRLQERLGVIKGRRTAYDAAMHALHDRAKLDQAWQASARRQRLAFPPGATWMVFTDGVLHAALSGQHAFEQTWLLPVEAMARPERSPLRVLEQLAGRALA